MRATTRQEQRLIEFVVQLNEYYEQNPIECQDTVSFIEGNEALANLNHITEMEALDELYT